MICGVCGGTGRVATAARAASGESVAAEQTCGGCEGRGVQWDETADWRRREGGFAGGTDIASDLRGTAMFVAYLVTGIAVLLVLLIPVGWWSEIAGTLRGILEALPLGDAVAERRREEGNPALIGVLSTVVVAAAIGGATQWRRRLARSYLWGGLTFIQLYLASIARTLVIFGGLSLIPNLVVIADGTDLREDPEQTFTGAAYVLIILGAWAAYSYFGLGKLVDREAMRPPRPEGR